MVQAQSAAENRQEIASTSDMVKMARMEHTAYLVALAQVDHNGRMLPQIHAVRIFSESARSLSYCGVGTVALDVHEARGDSYDQARLCLMHMIQNMAPLMWCLPLMDPRDREPVQRVTFGAMGVEEQRAAGALVAKWRGEANGADVVGRGLWLDRARYEALLSLFQRAGCEVPVLWGKQKEAA